MSAKYKFFVSGRPVPQGSMSSGIRYYPGKLPCGCRKPQYAFVYHSKGVRLNKWRDRIAEAASLVVREMESGAVKLVLTFQFAATKQSEPGVRTSVPDLDKLTRATLDALTGVLYEDDCQVWCAEVHKVNVLSKKDEGLMVEVY